MACLGEWKWVINGSTYGGGGGVAVVVVVEVLVCVLISAFRFLYSI